MLSPGAMRTQVLGTPDLDRSDYRKKGLGAQVLEANRVTARARHFQMAGIRGFKLQ